MSGGPVTDEDTGREDERAEDQDQPDTGAEDEGEDRDEEQEPEPPSAEEFAKLKRRAERRDAALRKAQAELAELKGKAAKEGDDQPDPMAEANARLVRQSARTVLAGLGVKDRQDQAAILSVLNLSDVEVDSNGDPDEDEISERLSRLRELLSMPAGEPRKRTPRLISKDRGGDKDTPPDPDKARYQRILLQGR